ncbi:MAG: adenosine deaminase [Erysipelotrichaceae bacterium]|nr:adenosine deaminase [Erysipelotrichaceae bacterium]
MKYPFPKVDLHFHLDGSIVPEVGWKIAQEPGVDLDVKTYEDYLKITTVPATGVEVDVFEYLAKFDNIVKLMQTREHLIEITYSTIKRACEEGLFYLEIRFAPQKHMEKGMTQKEAVEAVLEGIRQAAVDFPMIKVGLILCCMLSFDDNSAENEETVRLTEEFLGKGVVGVDLAGGEDSVPMENYAYLFTDYHKKGLPMTIHAGDNGKPTNVAMVIDWGANRVGHGKHCWYDKEVLQRVIDTKTPIEVCLTSNIHCKTEPSYEEHPAKKLLDAGVKVTLNTDNQSISNINLDFEYDRALEQVGFTYNDLIQMNINSIEASFMPEEDKPMFIAELRKYFK